MRSPAARYGVALVAVAANAVFRLGLNHLTGIESLPFLLFFGGVMVAAWYGGFGPGLLATATSALFVYFVVLPLTPGEDPLSRSAMGRNVGVVLFAVEGVLISYLSDSLIRAERSAHSALALRTQTEGRFRRLVESNMIGLVFWRETGEITDANDALLAMIDRSRTDLLAGRVRWLDVVVPECIELHRSAIEEIRERSICTPFETWIFGKDGRRVPILCAGAGLDAPFGGVGVSWVVDITAQKQLQTELRGHVAVIEAVNRIGQRLSAELDVDRLVQEVTDAATGLIGAHVGAFFLKRVDDPNGSHILSALSGLPRSAVAGLPMPRVTDVFAPTFRGERVVRLDDVTRDARYGQNDPYAGVPNGHPPVVSYLAVPVVSRSGEVLGALFFGHPQPGVFTERHEALVVGLAAQAAVAIDNARLIDAARTARAAAEAANHAKDQFLSVVSHELRTPLSSILNWLRVLKRSNATGGDRFEQALASMERSTKVQAKLIEDLLDVSRIVSGGMRLDPRPVTLATVVRSAVDAMLPTAEAKGVRLRAALDVPQAMVMGDPDRLLQVTSNVLSNAIKFTPSSGLVAVDLDADGSQARLTVRDTGRGIPREFLPHIFERFRQADPAATRAQSGLGLGLAIVQHLVELHGGTVTVDSAGEHCGATVTVTLPMLPPAALQA